MGGDTFAGRGTVGRLLVVYRQAARLHDWTLSATQDELGPVRVRIHARCSAIDRFLIAKRPLTVVLGVGQEEWRWRVERVELDGVQLSAIASGVPDVITLR